MREMMKKEISMNNSTLLRKIHMDCPICGMTHEVEERIRHATVKLKDVPVSYDERYYFCENASEDENEFAPAGMADENLLNARNAYRIQRGLLTSDEIVAIRESYGLSQVDLARLLGWGEATISRYESKAIQDDAYDNMLRLIKDNPLQVLSMFRKNNELFTDSKREKIREKIIDRINTDGREYLTRQVFEGEYVYFDEPSDYNGYTMLDVDKTEAAISYIAKKVANLYKVKLMKMLWYADALAFKKSGHAITGLVYRHNELGALPVGHHSLMNLERLNVQEEESVNYGSMIHIYPTEGMNYSVLNPDDIKVLDAVIKKFKNYNTKEIVDYMHDEVAYTKTRPGDIIPFSLAEEIRRF